MGSSRARSRCMPCKTHLGACRDRPRAAHLLIDNLKARREQHLLRNETLRGLIMKLMWVRWGWAIWPISRVIRRDDGDSRNPNRTDRDPR